MRRALVVLGLIACGKGTPSAVKAEHDRLPITVSASMLGASASEMAVQVANPLEDTISHVDGVERLHSHSTDGATTIVAEFSAQTDGYEASQKIVAAVGAVSARMPRELSPPTVMRGSHGGAVMRLILRSDRLSLVEITAVERRVAESLERIAGVGRVEACGTVEGGRTLMIDPVALAARGKTVAQALDGVRRWASDPGSATLDDLGVASSAAEPRPPTCLAFDATSRFVAITLTSQAGADVLEVRRHLEEGLRTTEASLPPTVHLEVWPRTRPLAFEVRLPPGVARDVQVARLQQALPRTGQVLAELGVTAARVENPDAADLRIVAPAADAGAIKAALEQHDLTVLDPSDHVVGISGLDPSALHAHAVAVAEALARVPGLHVIDKIGITDVTTTQLEIDRDAAARLGISAADVAAALRLLAPGGTEVATLSAVEPTPVFVTITGSVTDALETLRIGPVPLSAIVKSTRTSEPSDVFHEQRVPWVGLRIAGPLDALTAALAKLPIPAGIQREVREPD